MPGKVAGIALGLIVIAVGGPAAPQVSDFVLERQEGMAKMERALVSLGLMADGSLPYEIDRAKSEAVEIATWTGSILDTFGDTPASRHGAASRARQEVWTDPARFAVLMAEAEARADDLIAAARDGDRAALKGAVLRARITCDTCHTAFLKPLP